MKKKKIHRSSFLAQAVDRDEISWQDRLAAALHFRLEVIADHAFRDCNATAHLKKLQEASETIEHCVALLPKSEMNPQLRHYLERRSYDKALAWIEEKRGSRF